MLCIICGHMSPPTVAQRVAASLLVGGDISTCHRPKLRINDTNVNNDSSKWSWRELLLLLYRVAARVAGPPCRPKSVRHGHDHVLLSKRRKNGIRMRDGNNKNLKVVLKQLRARASSGAWTTPLIRIFKQSKVLSAPM